MDLIGALFIVGALSSTERWFDRHFLPSFFLPRGWYLGILTSVRIALAVVGVWLLFEGRIRIGRLLARWPTQTLSVFAAVVLALVAGEAMLRSVHLRPAEWLVPNEEPRRQADERLGWTFVPGRVGRAAAGGRPIDYAIDAGGFRVRRLDEPVDLARPTVVFLGESVMFGEGLSWDQSIPAQTGAMMRVQSANLAVHGYSTDQAYLRLERDLPRFRQPVGVVSLFMAALFGRNLDDDRPHLAPRLAWQPAHAHVRLASLATMLVPYRTEETVDLGVETTRQALSAIGELARRRGAAHLIVVPQLGAESAVERSVRRRVLDEGKLPYLLVEINGQWRLPWDRHPNAAAARAIAAAIAARLSSRDRY